MGTEMQAKTTSIEGQRRSMGLEWGQVGFLTS